MSSIVGIDVSKARLDVVLVREDQRRESAQFENTRKGFNSLRHFKEKFGVTATVGSNVDSFGHAGTLPQILRKSGMDHYIFMRPSPVEKGLPGRLFWWEADDGSRVLTFPDPQADQGRHVFTYSLVPGHPDSPLHLYAYKLNYPLHSVLVGAQPAGSLPAEAHGPGVSDDLIVETFKRAEDGDGWIVRVYEPRGASRSMASLGFGPWLKRAVECDLMEEPIGPATVRAGTLPFVIGPFEIKTFRVWF